MTYEALAGLAGDAGFTAWAALDINAIHCRQEVRDMCAADSCGRYGSCWSCPPGCGTLEECAARVKAHSHGILVQTVGDMEDSFDFDTMMALEAKHKAHVAGMLSTLRSRGEQVLALGAGCCTQCAVCTYPQAPCRFPEKMVSSMEAYGILVLEVCRRSGLAYYHGADKMAYTSCFLIE